MRVKIEGATIVPQVPAIGPGYGFCSSCGGLFKLKPDSSLPPHAAVGRGTQECLGGIPVYEGEVSS